MRKERKKGRGDETERGIAGGTTAGRTHRDVFVGRLPWSG